MADTTSSIKVTAGDYADPQLWENDTNVSAGRWIGEVQDNSEYLNKNISFSGGTGTPDADNFSWLRVASANKHAGVTGSGHARIRDTSGHAITVDRAFTVIEGLEIFSNSTTSSDECMRVNSSADNLLVSRCIIRANGSTAQQDGIYTNQTSLDIYVDNCVFYNCQRAGIHAQGSTTATPTNCYIDSCTFNNCGQQAADDGGGVMLRDGGDNNATIYNTWAIGNAGNANSDDYETEGTGGNATWAGTNNIAGDTSAESRFTASYDSVVLIDTDPGSGENVHVDSISGFDFNITDEDTETVTQNGVDRSATHPAPQTTNGTTKVQDLSTDIADVSRSGWSIGAFEFAAAASGAVASLSLLHRNQMRHMLNR